MKGLHHNPMKSKRYQEAATKIDKKKSYEFAEAIELVKQMSPVKFDAAIELHLNLGIDPTKGDQQVRGTLSLPHGTGKTKRVAAFVEAEKEAEAKAAGADLCGGEELVSEIIRTNAINFDVAVATPAMMPKLSKLAKILGPKGLMPNPKTDTISPNIGAIVKEQKAGKVSFKNDTTGNIHQVFGRVSFDTTKLVENLTALTEQLKKTKPSSSKGIYFKNAVICSTMSPGVKITLSM